MEDVGKSEERQITSGADNAETAINSDDTPTGDAPPPSPTEQREIITISDNSA